MTTSTEYNTIHALAYARKVLFDKFGGNLLHLHRWSERQFAVALQYLYQF